MEKKRFYGWPLSVILGFMYFCSSGFVLSTAMIVNPMMLKDPTMGLTGTLLSAGFSVFILMQGIPAPFIGQLIAKKGARFTMTLGGIVMVIGALAMIFFVREPIMYFLFFGVLMSIGSTMAGQISVQSTVGQWFVAKRGVAMTITMVIGGLASICAPLVVNAIVGASGGAWQSGWYLLAVLGIVIVPTALFLVRNKPSDVGQLPDGTADESAFQAEQKDFKVFKNTKKIEYKEALRSPAFWLIALAGTGGFTAYSLASSQGVIHFTSLGFEKDAIVAAVATMGAASLVGKLIIGFIADRIEPVRLMSGCLFLIAVGIVCAALAGNAAMLYVYYLCTGFGFGAITTNLPTTVANYFGTNAFSKNLGTVMLTTTIISSLVPIMSGAIFDATGFCTTAFFITAGIVFVCGICGLLVKFPKKSAESPMEEVTTSA